MLLSRRTPKVLAPATAVAALATLAAVLSPSPADAASSTPVSISVLSGRADLVSGGDALVQVDLPAGASPRAARMTVDGRSVTAAFTPVGATRLRGLVAGLRDGVNTLKVRLPDGRGATLPLTNHPQGGPVFAGPQVQPWLCDNPSGGNAPAQDAQCNAPVTYTYKYKDSHTGLIGDYDPSNPPGDDSVARTTTDQGKRVRWVVRVEHGVQDRGNYLIAVLFDPQAPTLTTWNHKLLVPFGGGAGSHHGSGPATDVIDDAALSRGFMVANNSMHAHAENTNKTVAAEALMMLKEHVVEAYGAPIRYTIGNGCSGGSIMQHMIAGEYPGLLDGLQPSCSFQDTFTTLPEVEDCHLLLHYFDTTSPQLWADPTQRSAVDGHKDASDCVAWDALFASIIDPKKAANCALPADQVYDPATRPKGVRCGEQDYEEAIWGPRASAQWGPVETQLGHGFARRPLDNVGRQYGLEALNAGSITPAQFVDLNTKVGGLDIDFGYSGERMQADTTGLATAYRTGQVTDARQLASVPIIDLRGYSETSEIHTSYHSYRMRARLDARNGTHGNQIIWTFTPAVPILPEPSDALAAKALLVMDDWLTRVEADTRAVPRSRKVLDDKPATATDGCFADTTMISTSPTCDGLAPRYDDALGVAGGPDTGLNMKCQLKPLDPADYAVALTAEQLTALRSAFPSGVCDWSRPGVAQQGARTWTTFAAGPGGTQLGAPPVSTPLRG